MAPWRANDQEPGIQGPSQGTVSGAHTPDPLSRNPRAQAVDETDEEQFLVNGNAALSLVTSGGVASPCHARAKAKVPEVTKYLVRDRLTTVSCEESGLSAKIGTTTGCPMTALCPSEQGAVFLHQVVIPILANSPLSAPADVRQRFERISAGARRRAKRAS